MSGVWEVSPADLFSPPFLIFIVDTNNLALWMSNTNLTQAINRIPTDEVLYLYDPFFRIDDIPGDNYRSDNINVRIPESGSWHIVFFAGASLLPLTFSWAFEIFNGDLLDITLYSLYGLLAVIGVTIFIIKIFKDRKLSNEQELEITIDEHLKRKEERNLEADSLMEENEEYIDNQ
ncbi:MAG: hypothetical protein JXA54_01205 [Candidatus Heimdallarchaeota archaeon]|nr:hypothetical protein [Candidatus Heimdallarchaeota archaeon]